MLQNLQRQTDSLADSLEFSSGGHGHPAMLPARISGTSRARPKGTPAGRSVRPAEFFAAGHCSTPSPTRDSSPADSAAASSASSSSGSTLAITTGGASLRVTSRVTAMAATAALPRAAAQPDQAPGSRHAPAETENSASRPPRHALDSRTPSTGCPADPALPLCSLRSAYGVPRTGVNAALPLLVTRVRITSIDVSSTLAEFDHLIPIAVPGASTR